MTDFKAWEREVAKDLGGERTGPTGKETYDVEIPVFAPECKFTQKLQIRKEWLQQARDNAKEKNKVPLLCLREANTGERVAVLNWKDFVSMYFIVMGSLQRIVIEHLAEEAMDEAQKEVIGDGPITL